MELAQWLITYALLTTNFTSVGWYQQYYTPPSPISPTSMAECSKLALAYSHLKQKISASHQSCLASKQHNSQTKSTREPGKRCSEPACQKLHDMLYDPYYSGTAEVNSCRQKVTAYLKQKEKIKEEQETKERHKREEKVEAEDNRKRKEYGDKWEREQPARDAEARKKAEADEQWRKKHDEWERDKEERMKQEHAERTREREERDKRLGLDDRAELHSAWLAREKERKRQELEINRKWDQILETVEDEDRRATMLKDLTKQLDRINEERKRDKEPKN